MRRALPVLIVLASALAPTRLRAAEPIPGVDALRRAYADRLSALAEEAKGAHLGSIALRLFEDANALAPDQVAARTALGWTREGAGWKPPGNVVPGEGWADDGEPELARFEKKESGLRADFVKALVAAAATARGRKAPADDVDEFLWAAVAIDPSDPAPRRALGHRESGGRFVAPAHAAIAAAGLEPTAADRAIAREAVELAAATPPVRTLAGWPDPVPAGFRAPSAGSVFSLSRSGAARTGAEVLERARRWFAALAGDETAAAGPAFGFVEAGSIETARALLAADPDARASLDFLGVRPAIALGRTGLILVVGESTLALHDALVFTRVENDVTTRSRERAGVRWLGQALGTCAALRLLGTTVGFAASSRVFSGVAGPIRRRDEPLRAFARRLVATGADPGLEAIAAREDRARLPRDVLVAGFVLDWLLRRDEAAARAFVATYLATTGSPGDRVRAASKAAGFASVAALDGAWRRFVADVHPVAPAPAAAAGGWKVAELDPMKSLDGFDSIHRPVDEPVAGSIWLGGRPYLCEVVGGGAAVRFYGTGATDPPRTTEKGGVFPFTISREYGGGYIDVRIELARGPGGWTARRAEAFHGTLDGHAVSVFDLDLDGRFGGFGRDGVAFDAGRLLLPLEREIALGSRVYQIRRVGPDGRQLVWRSRPIAVAGRDLEAFMAINDARVASGVPALVWDADVASGLAEPGSDVAARAIRAEEASPRAAVRRWLAGPPTCATLLEPSARRGAIATSAGSVTFAAGSSRGDEPGGFRGPLVYPAPDSAADSRRAGADLLRVLAVAEAGAPIVVRFADGSGVVAADVEFSLTTEAGTVVDARLLDHPPTARPDVLAFVPRAPLAASTAFRARLTYPAGGRRATRTWAFRTGSE